MGVIKALQNIFREPNEAGIIEEIVHENKRLKSTQDYIAQIGVFGEDGEDIRRYEVQEDILRDIAGTLILFEQSKGKISAEYTIYMLKKALERTRDNNYEKRDQYARTHSPKMEEAIREAEKASREWDEYKRRQ